MKRKVCDSLSLSKLSMRTLSLTPPPKASSTFFLPSFLFALYLFLLPSPPRMQILFATVAISLSDTVPPLSCRGLPWELPGAVVWALWWPSERRGLAHLQGGLLGGQGARQLGRLPTHLLTWITLMPPPPPHHPQLTLCSKRSPLHLLLHILSYSSTFCFLLPPHPVFCCHLVVSSEHVSHHCDELEIHLLLRCPLVAATSHTWAELLLCLMIWLVAPPPVALTMVDMLSLHTQTHYFCIAMI